MFTTIEETVPLLSKKEYIALEIAKALIANNRLNVVGLQTVIREANNVAHQIVEENA